MRAAVQEDQWGLCGSPGDSEAAGETSGWAWEGVASGPCSQDWGGEDGGRHLRSLGSASQALPVSRGLLARAAGMLARCRDPPRAQHLTHRLLLCPPPAEFVRRKKTALWFVGALLAVSASILTVGLAATTRTENVTVGGYYPGIIVSVGSLGAGLGAQDRRFRVVLTHTTPAPQKWEFRWLAASWCAGS